MRAQVERFIKIAGTLRPGALVDRCENEAIRAQNFIDTIPKIVCLCGSGRFRDAFEQAEFDETLSGKIVLTIGCNTKDIARTPDLEHHKPMLDDLHKRKIDLADEVLVLNVGGYIGDSTRSEVEYAEQSGKPVRWLEERPKTKWVVPTDEDAKRRPKCRVWDVEHQPKEDTLLVAVYERGGVKWFATLRQRADGGGIVHYKNCEIEVPA